MELKNPRIFKDETTYKLVKLAPKKKGKRKICQKYNLLTSC
jgi:hypothetical protein